MLSYLPLTILRQLLLHWTYSFMLFSNIEIYCYFQQVLLFIFAQSKAARLPLKGTQFSNLVFVLFSAFTRWLEAEFARNVHKQLWDSRSKKCQWLLWKWENSDLSFFWLNRQSILFPRGSAILNSVILNSIFVKNKVYFSSVRQPQSNTSL